MSELLLLCRTLLLVRERSRSLCCIPSLDHPHADRLSYGALAELSIPSPSPLQIGKRAHKRPSLFGLGCGYHRGFPCRAHVESRRTVASLHEQLRVGLDCELTGTMHMSQLQPLPAHRKRDILQWSWRLTCLRR